MIEPPEGHKFYVNVRGDYFKLRNCFVPPYNIFTRYSNLIEEGFLKELNEEESTAVELSGNYKTEIPR